MSGCSAPPAMSAGKPAAVVPWLLLLLLLLLLPQQQQLASAPPAAHQPAEASASFASESPVHAVPQLSGVFLSGANAAKAFNASRWDAEFRAMRELNLSFAVLRGVMYGDSRSWTAECPLGVYQSLYPPGATLRPPGCFERRGLSSPGGSLGAILHAAKAAGLGLHIGFVWPPAGIRDGPGDFDWNATDLPGIYPKLAALQLAVAKDIWAKFPAYRSTILGVYAELEVGNSAHWCETKRRELFRLSHVCPEPVWANRGIKTQTSAVSPQGHACRQCRAGEQLPRAAGKGDQGSAITAPAGLALAVVPAGWRPARVDLIRAERLCHGKIN